MSHEMRIPSEHLHDINLDDVNFYEDDPETIIHIELRTWHNRLKHHKACKEEISKELMPAA